MVAAIAVHVLLLTRHVLLLLRIEVGIVLGLFIQLPCAHQPMREPLPSPAEGGAATGEGTPSGSRGRRSAEGRVAEEDVREVASSGKGTPAASDEGRHAAAEEDSSRR
jgi:hypothetical protein